MADRIIGTYKSNKEGLDHIVRQAPNGEVYCSCVAGGYERQCWALKKAIGDLDFKRMMAKFQELRMAGRTVPDKEELMAAQQAYVAQREQEFHRACPDYDRIPTPPAIWQPEYKEWARLAMQCMRVLPTNIVQSA